MSVLTSIPTGGFLGATHHNYSATATFPAGTKVAVKQDAGEGVDSDSIAGYCVFVYMPYAVAAGSVACAAKSTVGLQDASSLWTSHVTADFSESNACSPIGIGLSAITTTYHGWFQAGGPTAIGLSSDVLVNTTLDGDFVTDGSVATGFAWGGDATLVGAVDGTMCGSAAAADTSNAIDAALLWWHDKWPTL